MLNYYLTLTLTISHSMINYATQQTETNSLIILGSVLSSERAMPALRRFVGRAAFADMVIKSTIRGRRKDGRGEEGAMVSAKWEGRMRQHSRSTSHACGKAKKEAFAKSKG